jgi:hypothetical protein
MQRVYSRAGVTRNVTTRQYARMHNAKHNRVVYL